MEHGQDLQRVILAPPGYRPAERHMIVFTEVRHVLVVVPIGHAETRVTRFAVETNEHVIATRTRVVLAVAEGQRRIELYLQLRIVREVSLHLFLVINEISEKLKDLADRTDVQPQLDLRVFALLLLRPDTRESVVNAAVT